MSFSDIPPRNTFKEAVNELVKLRKENTELRETIKEIKQLCNEYQNDDTYDNVTDGFFQELLTILKAKPEGKPE